MKLYQWIRITLLRLSVFFVVVGCGGGSEGGDPQMTEFYQVSTELNIPAAGTVSPSASQVAQGKPLSLSVTVNPGYQLTGATGCGGSLSGTSYQINAVTANCVVSLTFSAIQFKVTASAGSGGSISPAEQTVSYGEKASFTLTLDSGYQLDSLTGCDGTLKGLLFETLPLYAECQLNAKFVANPPPEVAGPERFLVQPDHGDVFISADAVKGALSYNLYLATEAGLTKTNYQTKTGGQKLAGLQLPYVLTGLDKAKKYYFVLTAMTDLTESKESIELSSYPVFKKVGGLNDTGISRCFNLVQSSACPVAAFPGQDAESGRDYVVQTGQLIKQGTGNAGFDFTKLDSNGKPLFIQHQAVDRTSGSESAGTQWHSVRDNVTGLVWLYIDSASGLKGTYSWYNPDSASNGGNAGVANGGQCIDAPCDTNHLVESANLQALGGFSDWRLPSFQELVSINDRVGYASPGGPARRDSQLFYSWYLMEVPSSTSFAASPDRIKTDFGTASKTTVFNGVVLVREELQ
ncbi:DUF1566 domain-containing protein [Rheinheimera sp.]|uniref:InlB B-repeat-containing protein n=1 Tax=Rheinheimera sp. TaxID=1869214 RepID=UPI00307DDAA3